MSRTNEQIAKEAAAKLTSASYAQINETIILAAINESNAQRDAVITGLRELLHDTVRANKAFTVGVTATEGALALSENAVLRQENARLRMELDASCNAEELRQVRAENARLREEVAQLTQAAQDTAYANSRECQFKPRELAEYLCREASLTRWDIDHWTRLLEGWCAKEKRQLRAALDEAEGALKFIQHVRRIEEHQAVAIDQALARIDTLLKSPGDDAIMHQHLDEGGTPT